MNYLGKLVQVHRYTDGRAACGSHGYQPIKVPTDNNGFASVNPRNLCKNCFPSVLKARVLVKADDSRVFE
jgi:hypothetical protein